MEYNLKYDDNGVRKALQIALAQSNRAFCFNKAKAIRNVRVDYTPAQLEKVRQRLSGKSNAQLRAELEQKNSEVMRIYRHFYPADRGFSHSDEYQDALAHVFLERGILVGSGDAADELYVDDGQ